MYEGLTTNLPREIMGFSDFPFSAAAMGGGRSIDGRQFPCSQEVGAGADDTLSPSGWQQDSNQHAAEQRQPP